MRKFLTSFSVICTLSAAAFLGACNKNCDSSCTGNEACCKEKAGAVKTDAQATPAASSGCCKEKAACKDKAGAVNVSADATPAASSGCCKSKAAGCSGAKKSCPATGQSN